MEEMAYKKYVKRNGKVFGPYYYESYRNSSGKVCKKYVGTTDPGKKKSSKVKSSKKIFLTLAIALIGILGLMFFVTNSGIVGNVILGDELVEQSFVVEDSILEIKSPSALAENVATKNKNKIMDFEVGGSNLRLYFDLLNYSEFVDGVEAVVEAEGSPITGFAVKSDKKDSKKAKDKVKDLDLEEVEEISEESVVGVEDFDIRVMESEDVDYKWGYEVRLDDLQFMAKVEVTSEEGISVLSDSSLRIGDSILSFADLEAEGYSVRIERPALEIAEEVVNESVEVLNETVNETLEVVNETVEVVNETIEPVDEITEPVNETEELVNETTEVINETIEPVNETINETVELVNETVEVINESVPEEEPVNETVVEEVVSEEPVPEEEPEEEVVEEEVVESPRDDSGEPEEPEVGITGNMIRGLVGFVIQGAEDLEYENSITVYIERDFEGTNYSVGDVIMLDPTLTLIEITKAVHLDVNRSFVSDVYDDVKSLDGVWSEVINDGEFVRVTFEVELDSSKDITVYARGNATLEVYENNGSEIIASFGEIVEGKNQVFLTSLNGTQDVFDLKVVGGSLEFDWIVDPVPTIAILYPENNSVTPYGTYPSVINYTSNVDAVWCWYNAGYGNSTAVNCSTTNFTNVQHNSPSWGNITWTVYGNDSAGNVGSASVTFSKENSVPVVDSIFINSSVQSDEDIYCSFDAVDPDYIVKFGDGGAEGAAIRPNGYDMKAVVCDDTHCYGGHENGHLSKTHKNGTVVWAYSRPYTTTMNDMDCDDTYCYGSHTDGYFTKTHKNGTIIIGTGGTESEAILPENYTAYGLSCDDTHCYAMQGLGYFTKTLKNGTVIWGMGGTEGAAKRPYATTTMNMFCDDTHCYTAYMNGYVSKIHKDGTIIWGTGGSEGGVKRPYTETPYSITCDDTYCYTNSYWGYFAKIHKNGTIIIGTGGTESEVLKLYSSGYMYDNSCDDTYCYGSHYNGYIVKTFKNGTVIWGMNESEDVLVRPYAGTMYAMDCDDTYCYSGYRDGYFTKVEKNSGDLSLTANLTWLKDGVPNSSIILDRVLQDSTVVTVLESGNTSMGENWSCEVTLYDGSLYGATVGSPDVSIVNSGPIINWSRINVPLYDVFIPEAEALYHDHESDEGTLYFEWFVNDVNVENDTVVGVPSGVITRVYLNSDISVGDIVNLTVLAHDGLINSELKSLQLVIFGGISVWGDGGEVVEAAADGMNDMTCDDTYCYGGHSDGYFTKTLKNGTVVIGVNGTESEAVQVYSLYGMGEIECDDTYCYGAHGIYFTKVYKNGTVVIGDNGTESERVGPIATDTIWVMFCDDTHCYMGDDDGYLTKVLKNGTVIFGVGGAPAPKPADYQELWSLFCDDTYCYGGHEYAYFTKTLKNGTIVVGYGGTEREAVQVYDTHNEIHSMDCDDTYCYQGHPLGRMTKTYKNGTVVWGQGGTERGGVYIDYPNSIYSTSCDDTYCYHGHNNYMISKVDKNSAAIIWSSSTAPNVGSSTRAFSCDDTYCYASGAGYFTKVLKSSNIEVFALPSMGSLNTPVDNGFENTDIVFGFTPVSAGTLSSCQLWGDWNGGWHLNQTSTEVVAGVSNEFPAINISDGTYIWNVRCRDEVVWGVFNDANYTMTVDTIKPIMNISYPLNSSVTSYSAYPTGIDYSITETNPGQCWYSAGYGNSTPVNCGTEFVDIEHSSKSWGNITWRVYGNDSAGNIGGVSITFAKTNTVPVVSSVVVNASVQANQDIYCSFDITDDDYFIKLGIGGVEGNSTEAYAPDDMYSIFCDDTYCYGAHRYGYFTKTHKNGTVILGINGTESSEVRPSLYHINNIHCDDTYCYGVDSGSGGGTFIKIRKDGLVVLGVGGSEGSAPMPHIGTDLMSVFCDDTYCYAGDYAGYLTKILKNGTIVWGEGGTEGDISLVYEFKSINDLTCDDTYCYGGHDEGYLSKTHKNGTVVWVVRPDTNYMYGLFCDDTHCYGAHGSGYLSKTHKNGTVVWVVRSDINSVYDVSCDDTYCYGVHYNGYFTKILKNGTIVWGINGTESEAARPSVIWTRAIHCDDTFCYNGNDGGYFTKVEKDSGDLLRSANLTWYKNGEFNFSSVLAGPLEIPTATTLLSSTGINRGENWSCEIDPYDGSEYGITGSSSNASVVNALPVVDWSRINAPLYDVFVPEAEASYSDYESDVGTLYFEWFVNDVSVENDSVSGLSSGTGAKVYLNSSIDEEDIVNMTVVAGDGIDNSSLRFLQNVIFGIGGEASVATHIGIMNGISCDDTYCYGGHNDGYFTKTFKNGTIVLGSGGAEGPAVNLDGNFVYGITCDDTHCYIIHIYGYFTKVDKNGTVIWGIDGTEGSAKRPYENHMNKVSCDDTHCYISDDEGYLVKVLKNGTTVWGTSGTEGSAIQPNTNVMGALFCDDTHCYGGHDSGHLTKTLKNGTIVWGIGGTEGAAARPNINDIFGITCDDTYCYGAHVGGYLTKVDKNGTIVLGTAGTEGAAIRPDGGTMYGITCDDTYCYGAHTGGYFTKFYKNGTILWGTNGIESEAIRSNTNNMYAITCDDTYCYGAHSSGHLTKTLKSLEIVVLASPSITSLDNPVDDGFETRDIMFGFTPIFDASLKTCELWGNWSGGWHLNQTLNDVSVGVNSNFSALNISEGTYLWNVKCDGWDIPGEFNSVNFTVTVDFTNPVITRYDEGMPANNSKGGESVYYNWTVSDNQDDNLTCYTMMDSTQVGVHYVSNASLRGETEILAGGPHSLYVRCYDNANNFVDSSALSYLVAIINMTAPFVDGSMYRAGDNTSFAVDEIEGVDWLNNASISIMNSSGELAHFYLNRSGDSHAGNYTWDGEPAHVTINAWGFNTAMGESWNATDSVTGIFLRAVGNTSSPVLTSACPNETYVVSGNDISIELVADLDTLILLDNVTIVDPDTINYKLTYEDSSIDNSGYVNSYDYTFNINKTGTYIILANVTDYENQTASWNYSFYSKSGYNTYRINSSVTDSMSKLSRCSGEAVVSGNDLVLAVPYGALIDLNATIADTLHNIDLTFRDVNLTGNLTDVVGYNEMSDEISAPEGERTVALFELNSTMSFSNYTIGYDYSAIAHTLNDESSLKMYKCENASSCVLVNTGATVNDEANILNVALSSFSYFLITESGTTVETVTTTTTTTKTVYRSLNIITPGDIELGLEDQIVVPIILNNPEDITLNGITLSANSSTEDIDPIFEDIDIETLGAGESKTIMLFLESHSLPGEYEVEIKATVNNPSFTETAILYVRLVEVPGLSRFKEKIILAQDLFRENPECLELNDLLIMAQRMIDRGQVAEAGVIVQEAIYKCRELVTAKEFPLNLAAIKEWRTPIMVSLGLIILALIIAVILRKPKIDLYRSRKKKKRWFGFGKKGK